MTLRSAAAALTALLGVVAISGTGAFDSVAELPRRLMAPAYDAVTTASVRSLATALTSCSLDEGTLDGVTVEELADWGWMPGERTAVTIWVAGDEFRVVAQDVGPGSSQFEYMAVDDPASSSGVVRSAVQPASSPSAAAVTIVAVGDL